MHKQPEGLLPGIYFNLDEEAYHSDPAFSHSGMVNILKHPYDYWYRSPLNPKRSFKPTEAMLFGKQCHKMLLEPDKFFEEYSVPGLGYSPGKRMMARADYSKICEAADMVKMVPDIYSYFTTGFSEVSIVYIDPTTGIRIKIRVDKLYTCGGMDYKRDKSIELNSLGWSIAEYGYDIQSELYPEGMREIKKLLKAKKAVVHDCPDLGWLKRFTNEEDCLFEFVFQRTIAPYVFKKISFDQEIAANARLCIERAKHIYYENITKYGTTEWPPGDATTEEFSIYNLPRKAMMRGA